MGWLIRNRDCYIKDRLCESQGAGGYSIDPRRPGNFVHGPRKGNLILALQVGGDSDESREGAVGVQYPVHLKCQQYTPIESENWSEVLRRDWP